MNHKQSLKLSFAKVCHSVLNTDPYFGKILPSVNRWYF